VEHALIEAVYHQNFRHASIFGIKVDNFSVDFEKIVERVNRITDSDSEAIKSRYHSSANPKLFYNECKFIGEKTISFVDEKEKQQQQQQQRPLYQQIKF
jgi:pyruvate/2-oxoglutarate dehydrogenase complex dihydrolipoamide dehydrogenase (E3) component